MDEPNPPLRRFGEHVPRNLQDIVSERVDRVDHDVLRRTRVRALSTDCHRGHPRAPRFVADLAKRSAVDGVREFSTESLDFELLDSNTNFLIRRKTDGDRAVLDV